VQQHAARHRRQIDLTQPPARAGRKLGARRQLSSGKAARPSPIRLGDPPPAPGYVTAGQPGRRTTAIVPFPDPSSRDDQAAPGKRRGNPRSTRSRPVGKRNERESRRRQPASGCARVFSFAAGRAPSGYGSRHSRASPAALGCPTAGARWPQPPGGIASGRQQPPERRRGTARLAAWRRDPIPRISLRHGRNAEYMRMALRMSWIDDIRNQILLDKLEKIRTIFCKPLVGPVPTQ
jgi:hypothetical protein